ncbi:MAG: hypothetical protein JXQ80_12050, partial [Bacteroidales bacterium]|nr:hypothetical protein [Bacteroidales bacterium]
MKNLLEDTIMRNEPTNLSYKPAEPKRESGKGAIAALIIALLLVLVVGTIIVTKNHKKTVQNAAILESQKLELATQLNQRDSIINEWVLAFNEIESDIKKITARENMLTLQSMNPEISKDKKQEIVREIEMIKELIDQNKKKIASLNAQLKNSGVKIASLQARVDTLG